MTIRTPDRWRCQVLGALGPLEHRPWKVVPDQHPQRVELVPLAPVRLEQPSGLFRRGFARLGLSSVCGLRLCVSDFLFALLSLLCLPPVELGLRDGWIRSGWYQ